MISSAKQELGHPNWDIGAPNAYRAILAVGRMLKKSWEMKFTSWMYNNVLHPLAAK